MISERWGVLLLAIALATGCAANPEPVVVPPSPTSPAPTTLSAPTVTQSLDLGSWATKPCDIVPSDALAEEGLKAPGNSGAPGTCDWASADPGTSVELTLYPDHDILGKAYSTATSDVRHYLPHQTGYGLPALFHYPNELSCTVTVGLSTRQGFQLRVSRAKQSPTANCDVVERLQSRVIETIKAGL